MGESVSSPGFSKNTGAPVATRRPALPHKSALRCDSAETARDRLERHVAGCAVCDRALGRAAMPMEAVHAMRAAGKVRLGRILRPGAFVALADAALTAMDLAPGLAS